MLKALISGCFGEFWFDSPSESDLMARYGGDDDYEVPSPFCIALRFKNALKIEDRYLYDKPRVSRVNSKSEEDRKVLESDKKLLRKALNPSVPKMPCALSQTVKDALRGLKLPQFPKPTLDELRTARRRAMTDAHPDHGGTHAAATKLNQEYETVLEYIDDPTPLMPGERNEYAEQLYQLHGSSWQHIFEVSIKTRQDKLAREAGVIDEAEHIQRNDDAQDLWTFRWQVLPRAILRGILLVAVLWLFNSYVTSHIETHFALLLNGVFILLFLNGTFKDFNELQDRWVKLCARYV